MGQFRTGGDTSRAEVAFKQAVIDELTHENAILKRLKFAAKSEAYNAEQKSLLEDTLDMDLAAVTCRSRARVRSQRFAATSRSGACLAFALQKARKSPIDRLANLST